MNQLHSVRTLAADPALPQRDLLLDEGVMGQYLSRLIARYGEFGLDDCERLRTKYRVGTSLRVLYELSNGEQTFRIAARAFPRTRRVANQFTPAAEVQAPELNTIFWVFPDDRKIKNLPLLNDIPRKLRDLAGEQWVASRLVGHAPEKSVTAQCLSENGRVLAYAKIYAGDEGAQIFDIYRELNAALEPENADLQFPHALSYSPAHHLLLLKCVPGISLADQSPSEDALFRLGKALKTLHRIKPPAALSRCTRFAPQVLAGAAATISQVRPDVTFLVEQLSSQLIAQHEDPQDAVLLHGDLHPKNILLPGARVALLDLDQATVGPATSDLGSVIAGLYCNASLGSLARPDTLALTRAFLAGYGPHNTDSLQWYVAAALLQERALRSVTRVRLDSLRKLPEILATAGAVLNGGTGED